MPKSVDHKNTMTNFFKDDVRRFINEDIYVGDLGRVTRYDKASKRCDVQPLALQTDGDKRAQWIEVIVPDQIKMINDIVDFMHWADDWVDVYNKHKHHDPDAGLPVKKWHHFDAEKEKHGFRVGSVVRVAFLDRDSTNWTGKGNYSTNGRMHSQQDPIVAEVVQL